MKKHLLSLLIVTCPAVYASQAKNTTQTIPDTTLETSDDPNFFTNYFLAAHHAQPYNSLQLEQWLLEAIATQGGQNTYSLLRDTLLKLVPNKNMVNKDNKSAVILAAENATPETMQLLLEKGFCPNAVDRHNKTALFYAVDRSGSEGLAIVDLLIEAHANIDHKDKNGYSVIDHARLNQKSDRSNSYRTSICDALKKYEATNKNSSTKSTQQEKKEEFEAIKETAKAAEKQLFEAILAQEKGKDTFATIQKLLTQVTNKKCVDKNNNSAIILAAQYCTPATVQTLIENGFCLDMINNEENALDAAIARANDTDSLEITKLLLKANIPLQDRTLESARNNCIFLKTDGTKQIYALLLKHKKSSIQTDSKQAATQQDPRLGNSPHEKIIFNQEVVKIIKHFQQEDIQPISASVSSVITVTSEESKKEQKKAAAKKRKKKQQHLKQAAQKSDTTPATRTPKSKQRPVSPPTAQSQSMPITAAIIAAQSNASAASIISSSTTSAPMTAQEKETLRKEYIAAWKNHRQLINTVNRKPKGTKAYELAKRALYEHNQSFQRLRKKLKGKES